MVTCPTFSHHLNRQEVAPTQNRGHAEGNIVSMAVTWPPGQANPEPTTHLAKLPGIGERMSPECRPYRSSMNAYGIIESLLLERDDASLKKLQANEMSRACLWRTFPQTDAGKQHYRKSGFAKQNAETKRGAMSRS